MLKRVGTNPLTLLAGGLLAAGFLPAIAGAETITNGNSSLTVNLTGPAGYFSGWAVDGINQLSGANIAILNGISFEGINSLTLQGTPFFGGGISDVTYGGVINGDNVTVAVEDILTGGSPGSGSSAISETITVHNSGPTQTPGVEIPADGTTPVFEIEESVNYSVGGNATNNTLTLSPGPNPNTATQTDPAGAKVTYAATPVPSSFLNGSSSTDLGPSGPGNESFSFDWDLPIPVGESAIISVTEAATGPATPPSLVPLPSSLWNSLATLTGLGIFTLIRRARRTIA